MRKLFLIVHSNIRKAKGQTIAIIVLILLSSLMLNLWLMLSMDYKANFERYHDKLFAEHVTFVVEKEDSSVNEYLSLALEDNSHISEYEMKDCMFMVGTFPYNGGIINSQLVFVNQKDLSNTRIGKTELIEKSDLTSGIYLPLLYKSNKIDIGKEIEISVGSTPVKYTVCGFFNSIMMGSHNCSLLQIVLTEDKYQELLETGYAPESTLCSIRLVDKSENLNFEASLKGEVSKQFPNVRMASNSYAIVSQSRYISQMICSGILIAMAFFVLLIALVIIVSNIINYLQVNIQGLGTFKAMGYTSRQLIWALLLQFLGLTLLVTFLGTAISYSLFPALNEMMIAQTGIPYEIHFLPLPFLISLGISMGTVALAVYLTARRIKHIEPIIALRSGIHTHNFKRNPFPLEQGKKASLNLMLALKTTCSGIKHNITICITMLVLSLIVVFSGLMTENVIADMTPFLNLIVGETADDCINVQAEIEEEFLSYMEEDSRVEKIYLYNSLNVSHIGGAELMATLSEDFSKANNQNVVYEGRFPKYDNEIAIAAKYAKESHLQIGDEIELIANGVKEKYLISGYTQISNNLGRDCLLTRAGYEKMGQLTNVSYYINLKEDTDIDAFNVEIKNRFGNEVNVTINVGATVEAAGKVYVSLMTIIVLAILILSAIIIAFVLYLLVRTMLNNKKKDYGILKALGFTTKQLVIQTALSFMPSLIVSTILGLILSSFAINPLLSFFLSSIGIVKCTFAIPVPFLFISGICLICISFGIACLLSLRVKKITPHTLLVGE